MSKFVKLLLVVFLFGIGSQLLGQDVYDTPEEVDREISKQEQREVRQNLAQEKMNKLSCVRGSFIAVPVARKHITSKAYQDKDNAGSKEYRKKHAR